ncbi:Nudix (Nucleoside diphosphate linked moiety X)-type motif 1 [Entomortierella chlamydospora]|uniref:Oxidized purine nucleoside triphosphate hydrolase n=1 Tax=Entomortierella chlamydospora TaxID=101097 RepID=A0A9P6MR18_9FUNG|nr:Nudix (Nucleoside diphosphate linked moiety X)-type motif 1 [Entomortierella chlamydospora]
MDPFHLTAKKVLTLVMVMDKDQQKILLGYKKRGFGAHLWNGFGGKVEPGETPKEGALRELEEEAGITVKPEKLYKAGILLFLFENDPVGLETHVYKAFEHEGQIRECDEMRPQWFNFADIPFDQMWEDDRVWLPKLLQGQDPLFGKMYFKRKPLDESVETETIAVTAPVTPVPSATSFPVNVSTTMTSTSFTTTQPINGPFAMSDYKFEQNLPAVPREIALDGTIASFEN